MNAIPKRQDESKLAGSTANPLVDAFVQKANTLADHATRRAKLDQLRASATEDMLLTCQTRDGREAEFRVYYEPNPDGNILAAELVQLDFCLPTPEEQACHEAEFESELDSGGDLWSRVASRIWE